MSESTEKRQKECAHDCFCEFIPLLALGLLLVLALSAAWSYVDSRNIDNLQRRVGELEQKR